MSVSAEARPAHARESTEEAGKISDGVVLSARFRRRPGSSCSPERLCPWGSNSRSAITAEGSLNTGCIAYHATGGAGLPAVSAHAHDRKARGALRSNGSPLSERGKNRSILAGSFGCRSFLRLELSGGVKPSRLQNGKKQRVSLQVMLAFIVILC